METRETAKTCPLCAVAAHESRFGAPCYSCSPPHPMVQAELQRQKVGLMPYQEEIAAALGGGERVLGFKHPPRYHFTVQGFAKALLDNLARSLKVPYEHLGADFTRVEYSMTAMAMRSQWHSDRKTADMIRRRLTIAYFSPRGPRIRSLLGSHTGRRRRRGERLMQSELRKPEGYFWKGRPAATIIGDEVEIYG